MNRAHLPLYGTDLDFRFLYPWKGGVYMHNRQKRIACVLVLCLMTSACAVPVHANLAAGIWAGSVLGTIFHTNHTGGRSPGIHRKNQQKYKDAMHELGRRG